MAVLQCCLLVLVVDWLGFVAQLVEWGPLRRWELAKVEQKSSILHTQQPKPYSYPEELLAYLTRFVYNVKACLCLDNKRE